MSKRMLTALFGATALLAGPGPTLGEPVGQALHKGDALPGIEAETLAESVVRFPDALEDGTAVVIFTFSKDGGKAAGAWARSIGDRFSGDLDTWQVMVLDGVPRLFRGFAVGGIRRGMPEAMHARSLTLFEDGELWRSRCAVEPDDVPCVILVDEGIVRWIQTATVTDALLDDLERAFRKS